MSFSNNLFRFLWLGRALEDASMRQREPRPNISRPNLPPSSFDIALEYFNNESWTNAIEFFLKVLELNPKHYESCKYTGFCYINLELYQQSSEYLKRAFEINPEDAQVNLNLGISLYNLQNLVDASRYLHFAKIIQPDLDIAYFFIGLCALRWENFENVESYIKELVELKSNYADELNKEYMNVLEIQKKYNQKVSTKHLQKLAGTEKMSFNVGNEFKGNHIGSSAQIDDSCGILAMACGGFCTLWDISTGDNFKTLVNDESAGVRHLWFLPDGRRIIVGCFIIGRWDAPDTLVIWDMFRGVRLQEITLDISIPLLDAISVSPDGGIFASADASFGDNGLVTLWDVETGEKIRTLDCKPSSLAFSPDGAKIATSQSGENNPIVWDSKNGNILKRIHCIYGHGKDYPFPGSFDYLQFKDANTLIGIDDENRIILIDINSGQGIKHFASDICGSSFYQAINKNRLAVHVSGAETDSSDLTGSYLKRSINKKGDSVLIWNMDSGKVEKLFNRKGMDVVAIKFSPENNVLILWASEGKAIMTEDKI